MNAIPDARFTLEQASAALDAVDRANEYIAYINACPPYQTNGRPGGYPSSDNPPTEPEVGELLSVREILADPELCRPPEAVIPRLAYSGRSSMLYAREKVGKSELARGGAAAVSMGSRFLGEDTDPGVVLWVALEEHIGDAARGLAEFGCDQEAVLILDRVTDPIADLYSAIERTQPVLVVIDTLAAFVVALGLEPGSSKDWAPVVLGLTRIAHDTGTALLVIHHGTKGGSDYRDSTAIGASVDLILGMTEGDEPSTRKVKSKGRWRTEDFAIRLTGNKYELAAGELSLDARVLLFLENNTEASTTAVRAGVQGQAKLVDAALGRLERRGAIEDVGGRGGHKWKIAGQGLRQGGLSLE